MWAGRTFIYRCCCHVTNDVFISGQEKKDVKFQQQYTNRKKCYTFHKKPKLENDHGKNYGVIKS